MKFREGLTIRRLAGEYIIVKPMMGMQDMTNVFTLNKTTAYLWENLYGKEFTAEDILSLLLEKYDVQMEIAQKDTDVIIELFRENNLLVE